MHSNTIDTSGETTTHRVELYKPGHVLNALLFLFTFMHTQHLLQLSKNNFKVVLAPINPDAKLDEEKEGLVQKIRLANAKNAVYYNLRLNTLVTAADGI